MFERGIEAEVLPFCRQNNISVLPYSSLAHGLLTGKFHENWEFGDTDFRPKIPVFAGANFKKNLAIVERLKAIASDKGITMAELAIAWVLARPGITSALVAAKSPKQVDENIPAADVKLSSEDLDRIDEILPKL
jgi:aryl-alcohol dehydrogenase-like predicted oxidoreductase